MGSRLATGVRPDRIAGTFPSVSQSAVEPLRNHVESPASAAKFGYRTASIRSRRSISDTVVSSSKTTSTTGVFALTVAACTFGVLTKTSFDTDELRRKSARKRIGAGARTLRNERKACA